MHRLEAYLRLALIFIGIITILYLPAMFALRKRGVTVLRQIGGLGLFCSLFLILFATIFFTPITVRPEEHILNLMPFSWIGKAGPLDQLMVEKIPNVLLFVPLGFFLPVVFGGMRKWYRVMGTAFAVTFGVEFVQYFIGRSADVDDMITNLLGAAAGYLAFRLLDRLLGGRGWWKGLLHGGGKGK